MTDEDLILALDAAGWRLDTSPRSGWVVLRRGSHIFAGPALRDVATRIQRLERQSEPRKNYKARGTKRKPKLKKGKSNESTLQK